MEASIKQQFLNPSEEYSPIPFWFWNDRLTKNEIRRQIHDFHDKGVTGFVLHPRIGIPEDIDYLSDSFLELVQTAVKEAGQLGMSVILYDEAMYPSGSAKGRVVQSNPDYASKGLALIEYPCNKKTEVAVELDAGQRLVSAQAVKKRSASAIDMETVQLLSLQDEKVIFTPPDENDWSILLFIEQFSEGTIRGIHFGEDDGEENAPPSADLLNAKAVAKYIELTHETYYASLSSYFGNPIIAMFTDEPDILGRGAIPHLKPWTTNFLSFYITEGNQESHLAALWLDAGEQTAAIRKKFRKTINKRLTESYYKQISDWCQDHRIALTGHPAASDDIGLLESFQIPGQDVVWRWVGPEDGKAIEGEHSTAGKCSADAARHRGRRRNLNEFLGVCGKESDWALSPGDMKWYIDWLAVRGVNLFCPHAFYYSIDGRRRSHERPPDVGPNNLWWPYYKQFAQYMKRLSWLMTDSVNQTSVAVLCEEDHLPWEITKPLYENQIEFNYLEESLFQSSACLVENAEILVAEQTYSFIMIENGTFLDQETVSKLESFITKGGTVITCQNAAAKSIAGARIAAQPEQAFKLLMTDHQKEVELYPQSAGIRVSLVKKNGLLFYLFVNEGEQSYQGTLTLNKSGRLERWDPWKGSIEEIEITKKASQTVVPVLIEKRESVVYCLDVSKRPSVGKDKRTVDQLKRIAVEQDWFVSNTPVNVGKVPLKSWIEWEGMEEFSGTVRYESSFEVSEAELHGKSFINLGEVYETAAVAINDNQLGRKMWPPYRFEVQSDFIKAGRNVITIDVTNSIANQMDNARLKSGLIGPVSVEILYPKAVDSGVTMV